MCFSFTYTALQVLDPVRASGNCLRHLTFPTPIADPRATLVGGDSRMYLPPLRNIALFKAVR